MKVKRALTSVAVMAAVTCGIVVAAPTPGLAHDISRAIATPAHYYGRVQVLQSHHRIKVCDERAEGTGVWVEFYTSDGLYHSLNDANGSDDPCGSYTDNSVTIASYRGHSRDGMANTGWQTP